MGTLHYRKDHQHTHADNRLPPACLKVLGAILQNNGLPMTIRELMTHFGYVSPNAIKPRLTRLKEAGLIHYEEGKARTVRATCTAEVFSEATPEIVKEHRRKWKEKQAMRVAEKKAAHAARQRTKGEPGRRRIG